MRNKILSGLIIACSLAVGYGNADESNGISANVNLANDYVWRGLPQHGDDAEITISGGFDFDAGNGFAVGVWGSNVSATNITTEEVTATLSADVTAAVVETASVEVDIYASYAGEIEGVGYEVGYIGYLYPNATSLDFGEVYISGSFADFGVTYYLGLDEAADNVEVTYDLAINDDVSANFVFGNYTDSNSYYGVGAGISFGGLDYSANYIAADYEDADTDSTNSFVVSVGSSF